MAGLQDLLSWMDSKRRLVGRNLSDLIQNPSGVFEQIDDQAKNYNQTVQPVAQGGSLYNRPMTEAEKDQRSIDLALNFGPMGVGVLRNAPMQAAATKHFGTTFSPAETGFILDNGARLDLSGRHYASGYQQQGNRFVPSPGKRDYLANSRAVDHRELDDLVPAGGWDGLSDFVNQTGAVRYMPDMGISVVDTNMPNAKQIQKAVEDFRRSRTPMNVDVDTLSGSSRSSQ